MKRVYKENGDVLLIFKVKLDKLKYPAIIRGQVEKVYNRILLSINKQPIEYSMKIETGTIEDDLLLNRFTLTYTLHPL